MTERGREGREEASREGMERGKGESIGATKMSTGGRETSREVP